MAYRRLYAVTFAVLGLLAVGCGGDTNGNVSASNAEQQPPTNKDAPPSNSDRASNPDQTPSNPDQPTNNASDPAGTGGGGRLGTLCQDLCNSIERLGDQCGDGMSMMGDSKSLCATGCQIPANVLPCEQEIADAFSCLIDNLQLLCSTTNEADQEAAASICEDALKAETGCAKANGITDDNDNNTPAKCSKAGGCDCATDCLSCTCDAGADQKKLSDCADTCANP